MNLRQQAAADLKAILEDSAAGFAVQVTVKDPYSRKAVVSGLYRDTDLGLDLQTNTVVMSHTASIVLSLATLNAAQMGGLRNVSDSEKKPYVVELVDQGGVSRKFKVSDTSIDELGAIVCFLETYQGP
jgi:hypothetical protein